MKHLSHWLTLGIATTFTVSAYAATVVEQRDAQGNTQKVTIDKEFARMAGHKPEMYMLVDFQSKKTYMINTKEQRVIENDIRSESPTTTPFMPPSMNQHPSSPPAEAEVKLVKIGDGPEIAGYATTHYQTTANGQVCSDDYFSESAAKVEYIQNFSEVMQRLSKKTSRAMPFTPANPCIQAYNKLQSESLKYGVELKSVSKDGKVRHEVLGIKTGVEVATDTFKIPESYKVMTEKEMMEQMRKRFEEMQKNPGNAQHGMPGMMPPRPGQQ